MKGINGGEVYRSSLLHELQVIKNACDYLGRDAVASFLKSRFRKILGENLLSVVERHTVAPKFVYQVLEEHLYREKNSDRKDYYAQTASALRRQLEQLGITPEVISFQEWKEKSKRREIL